MIKKQISGRRLRVLLMAGILGCLLMGGSDWLMIYGDTAYEGALSWLTAGVAEIPAWRNSIALLLAFPAVLLYSVALFAVKHFLREPGEKTIYGGLTALGMTPWLSVHLFYIMILYLFGWMQHNGLYKASFGACEALFGHFAWLIPVSEAIMLLPFLFLFLMTVLGKTYLPRWMAVNNPLIIFAVLKLITGFLPDTPLRLAFVNGLMSEAMAVWFLILMTVGAAFWKRER